jgi:hypothetical protein
LIKLCWVYKVLKNMKTIFSFPILLPIWSLW